MEQIARFFGFMPSHLRNASGFRYKPILAVSADADSLILFKQALQEIPPSLMQPFLFSSPAKKHIPADHGLNQTLQGCGRRLPHHLFGSFFHKTGGQPIYQRPVSPAFLPVSGLSQKPGNRYVLWSNKFF